MRAQSNHSQHLAATASHNHQAGVRAHMHRPTLHSRGSRLRRGVTREIRASHRFVHCPQTGTDVRRRPISHLETPTCRLSQRHACVANTANTTLWQKEQYRHLMDSTSEAPRHAHFRQSVPKTQSMGMMAPHLHKQCTAADLRIHSFVWT